LRGVCEFSLFSPFLWAQLEKFARGMRVFTFFALFMGAAGNICARYASFHFFRPFYGRGWKYLRAVYEFLKLDPVLWAGFKTCFFRPERDLGSFCPQFALDLPPNLPSHSGAEHFASLCLFFHLFRAYPGRFARNLRPFWLPVFPHVRALSILIAFCHYLRAPECASWNGPPGLTKSVASVGDHILQFLGAPMREFEVPAIFTRVLWAGVRRRFCRLQVITDGYNVVS